MVFPVVFCTASGEKKRGAGGLACSSSGDSQLVTGEAEISFSWVSYYKSQSMESVDR